MLRFCCVLLVAMAILLKTALGWNWVWATMPLWGAAAVVLIVLVISAYLVVNDWEKR